MSAEETELLRTLLTKVEQIEARLATGFAAPMKSAYTLPEAAKELSISTRTLRRRIDARLVPTIKTGGLMQVPGYYFARLRDGSQM